MDKDDITGGQPMIADELKVLFDDLKADIIALRTDITLINHDMIQIREQLDRIENNINQQPQESIGIAPNTPGPDFIPPMPIPPEFL